MDMMMKIAVGRDVGREAFEGGLSAAIAHEKTNPDYLQGCITEANGDDFWQIIEKKAMKFSEKKLLDPNFFMNLLDS